MNAFIIHSVLAILIFLSVITWTIAVVKIKQFKRTTAEGKSFEDAFWQANSWDSGKQIAKQSNAILAQLAQTGFKEFDDYKNNPQSLKNTGDVHEILERPLKQEIQKILRAQEKGLSELASIGSTAPFIGLFGTVWGIMVALQEISASGQASIDVVAGPIGEALIATAVGIAAALPAVLFYNYFVRRLKVWVTDVDSFSEAFLRLAAKQAQSQSKS